MSKIRKGDEVIVRTGKDKGKIGNVLAVRPDGTALVNAVNVVKRHTKPNPMKGVTGGILDKEAPIRISNLALYNPQTKKADRVGFRKLEDGRKLRVFRSTGESADTK